MAICALFLCLNSSIEVEGVKACMKFRIYLYTVLTYVCKVKQRSDITTTLLQ